MLRASVSDLRWFRILSFVFQAIVARDLTVSSACKSSYLMVLCVEVALANGILCARCVALARKTFVFFTSLVYKSPHSLSCFHRGKTGELTNPCPRRKKGSSIIIINIYIE